VQPAATPNVNEAREVTLRGVRQWRGGARGAEGDGKQEDGDGQGRARMTKMQNTHDRLPWLPRGARCVEVPAFHLPHTPEGLAGSWRNLPHHGQAACGLDGVCLDEGAMLATYHRVPAIYPLREYAEVGGLMSYGSNVAFTVQKNRFLGRDNRRRPSKARLLPPD
jgi:hypothetical protein